MSFLPKRSAPGLLGSIFILLCLASCASKKQPDYSGLFAQLTPARWQQPGVWDFHMVDQQHKSMGHMLLRLTGESVTSACDDADWKRAVIVEDELDYPFGFELQPAYRVHGNWLTIDLTASVCGADHLLNGELEGAGASGFFNYSHRLGGNNIGTFVAVAIEE
jgi:hypothetical protein